MITTLVAFAFVLGVLVFVHELGHFLAAKRVGIRVLKFQLGFNPTIVSFRRGDTEYGIGALPLGGYVKMAGEAPEDVEHDERGNAVRQPDEFMSKTKWERFQVLIMGPVMNIILAFVVTTFVVYRGVAVPSYQNLPPVVGIVTAGSPAQQAGIQAGDRLVALSGHRVDTWNDFYMYLGTRRIDRELSIDIERNGQRRTVRLTPVAEAIDQFETANIGVAPNVHPHLESVNADDPAGQSGLKPGDVIVAFDGRPMTYDQQFRDEIKKHPNQQVALSILRAGQPMTIDVRLASKGQTGWLGAAPLDDLTIIKPGFLQAISMSVDRNVEYTRMIGQTLWGLFTRETSPKQLMGPIGIAQAAGQTASVSLFALFNFMAMISLNLGLVNLLPIPVLDGGHIFIMALEGVARRDFSIRVKEKMLLAGFVLILMLMVTVIYNDLTRISWIERLMPWR